MAPITITSPCFENGGLIPVENTGYGADRSPELRLSALDEKAQSIAVIMNDLGHPVRGYNHWLIWNLPPASVLPGDIPHGEAVPTIPGAVQGHVLQQGTLLGHYR